MRVEGGGRRFEAGERGWVGEVEACGRGVSGGGGGAKGMVKKEKEDRCSYEERRTVIFARKGVAA